MEIMEKFFSFWELTFVPSITKFYKFGGAEVFLCPVAFLADNFIFRLDWKCFFESDRNVDGQGRFEFRFLADRIERRRLFAERLCSKTADLQKNYRRRLFNRGDNDSHNFVKPTF